MNTKMIQIEQIDAQILLDRFTGLENQIRELKESIKPPTPTNENDYLTRKQVADIFHIAIMTVHHWHRKGILKSYKVGHRVYFKRGEIDQALVKMRTRKGVE